MAKRARAAAQDSTDTTQDSKDTTNTDSTPAQTGRPAPVHFDELFAIWPADPRIPSVESRRAWSLARNITPSYVHNASFWFSRRRPVAKKLRLKIPAETYELPVGTPPVVPIVIKDEPVDAELPAPAGEPTPKRTTKKKVKEEDTDALTIPPKKDSKKKTKKADPKATTSNADVGPELTKKDPAPADEPKRTKKKKVNMEEEEANASTLPLKKKTKKVDANVEPELPTKNPAPANEPTPKRVTKKVNVKEEEANAPTLPLKKDSKKKTNKVDANVEPELTKKSLKRKRDDPPSDDVPESSQPKNKRKKALADDSATDQAKPKRPTKKTEVELDAMEVEAVATKQSNKRTKKADIELPNDTVPEPAPTKSKRKRNVNTDPTPDGDVPEPTARRKKKAKTTALEPSIVPVVEPADPEAPPRRTRKKKKTVQKKTVRFDSPSADMPPSSSPTLYASSPPPSDALTAVDDTPPSSPLSKSQEHAYTQSRDQSTAKAKDLNTNPQNASAKENRAPLKSALKKGTKSSKKRKHEAAPPAPIREEEEEEEESRFCDQGNHLASTGFTCILCAAPTGDDSDSDSDSLDATDSSSLLTEPTEVFDWHFGFGAFSGPPDDYTDIVVDVTPLSAIPFLTAPAEYLGAAAAEPLCGDVGGLSFTYDVDGFVEMDGQKFTYDGIAVDEHGAGVEQFFPVLPTGDPQWKMLAGGALLMSPDGDWLHEEDAEGEENSSEGGAGGESDEGSNGAAAKRSDEEDGEEEVVDVEDLDEAPVLRLSFNFFDE
ncbi:hypothetical protein DFH08DRAFT_1003802 [Mycena albidolilacea]|uniref:Uncharacterized protein n=1 Tax=Mycena albidolilacea TaxID=1033008 RepID=A0AAD7ARE3_9AGAR|nr:hypothetical protein DFH08DRAFT_1003802 [Mycena albidolilacea]